MRNKISGLLLSFLILACSVSISGVSANTASLSVHTAVDPDSGVVSITGKISTGAGGQITIVIADSAGQLVYVDQTTSTDDGSYLFQLQLDDGTYDVSVGGSGLNEPVTVSLTYPPYEGGNSPGGGENPSDGGGNPPGGGENPPDNGGTPPTGAEGNTGEGQPDTAIQHVDESALVEAINNGNQQSVIQWEKGKAELHLPAKTADLLGDKPLHIEHEAVVVIIDKPLAQSLIAGISPEQQSQAVIAIRLDRVSGQDVQADKRLNMTQAAQAVRIGLSARAAREDVSERAQLSEPFGVSFAYDVQANESLLGIYYYNEQMQTWNYIGGKVDREAKRIAARTDRLGIYAVFAYDKTFEDVSEQHWAYETIRTMTARHIVQGVSDSDFAPSREVNRAEFVTLLARALGLSTEAEAPFNDVDASAYYAPFVAAAYEAGLIQGKSPQQFGPTDNISRQEMAIMLVRAVEYRTGAPINESPASFSDGNSIAPWADSYVNRAVKAGVMQGIGNNRFAPAQLSNRAEAAQAILNMLVQYE